MRHNRDEKRFDRTYSHLRAMFANMTNDLVMHGRIKTTLPKAKELRKYAERMITLGKKGALSSRRLAFAFMRSKEAVTKLFSEVAGRYGSRNGGYTRIMKLGSRPGDSANMAIIELVESGARSWRPRQRRLGKSPAKAAAAADQGKPKAAKTSEAKQGQGKGKEAVLVGREIRTKDLDEQSGQGSCPLFILRLNESITLLRLCHAVLVHVLDPVHGVVSQVYEVVFILGVVWE